MSKSILQPPALEIDKVIYKNKTMGEGARLERRIAWNLFAHLKAAGFELHGVHNGEEFIPTNDPLQAMEEVWGVVDCAHVKFIKAGQKRWVLLVHGNHRDMISDYGSPREGGQDWIAAMESFDAEALE